MCNYEYPIELTWSHDEMKMVVSLWNAVELAYEQGVEKEDFLIAYRNFKKVIPSKGEEKRYSALFEKRSGYSLYRVLQVAKTTERKIIVMEDTK